MTTRLVAAFAAFALTVGILVGAAGTVLIHDSTRPEMGMGDMAGMHQMMSGIPGGMMKGSMMDGPMGPGSFMDPAQHEAHHAGSRP